MNMPFALYPSKTYSQDLELLKELGLKPFQAPDQEEILVGQYKLPHHKKAKVKIWVSCMPAQFWRFEINTEENRKFEANTGSGCLSEYWPGVLKIAEGMMEVKKLNK